MKVCEHTLIINIGVQFVRRPLVCSHELCKQSYTMPFFPTYFTFLTQNRVGKTKKKCVAASFAAVVHSVRWDVPGSDSGCHRHALRTSTWVSLFCGFVRTKLYVFPFLHYTQFLREKGNFHRYSTTLRHSYAFKRPWQPWSFFMVLHLSTSTHLQS